MHRVERFLYDFAGGSHLHWKRKHGAHHAHTNDTSKDPDIMPNPLIQFTRGAVHRQWLKRHQWWYQWLVFPLVPILLRVNGLSHLYKHEGIRTIFAHHIRATPFLIFHVVRPCMIHGLDGLTYYLITCCVVGILYGAMFSVSHVNDIVEYDVSGDDFTETQLRTTVDWRPGCRFTNWLTVGLNNQAVHHVYPHRSSYDYIRLQRELSKNTSYRSFPTFWDAIKSNARHLYNVGSMQSKTEEHTQHPNAYSS